MMKSGAGNGADRRVGPAVINLFAAITVLFSLMLLDGCASNFAIEDAVPHPAADGTYGGPRDTGQYPNLNIRQKGATSQLTDAEVAANTKELNGAKTRLGAGPAATSDASADIAGMRQAGKAHNEQVLKEIEGQ
jgi:hypothetical protein